jgi:hypothetical protein
MSRHLGLVCLALPLAVACAEDPPFTPPNLRPVAVVPTSAVRPDVAAVVREYDLSALAGPITGVTIEPETGRRVVVTQNGYLYELGASEPIGQLPAAPAEIGYTDIAALGGGRFALSTMSDGYLFDLATGELTPHFCYEPGWFEEQDPANPRVQLSMALAHVNAEGRIYAQPRTIEDGGQGAVTESFIASYDEAGGEDLTWWGLPDPNFEAGGMAAIESGADTELLLAWGPTLYRFGAESGELRAMADLSGRSISFVTGLAIDREAETILVVDGSDGRVTELRLSAMGL